MGVTSEVKNIPMSGADIAWILVDVVLLVLFGTALSSIINIFLSTQGQISAVGTIVSAGYGFICGAYMPISNFGGGPLISSQPLFTHHLLFKTCSHIEQNIDYNQRKYRSPQIKIHCSKRHFTPEKIQFAVHRFPDCLRAQRSRKHGLLTSFCGL